MVSKRRKPGPGAGKPQHPGTVVVVAPGTVVVVVVDPGGVVVVVATVVVVVPIGIGSVGSVIVGIGTWAIWTGVFATGCAWPGLSPRSAKLGSAARRRPRATKTSTTSLMMRLLPVRSGELRCQRTMRRVGAARNRLEVVRSTRRRRGKVRTRSDEQQPGAVQHTPETRGLPDRRRACRRAVTGPPEGQAYGSSGQQLRHARQRDGARTGQAGILIDEAVVRRRDAEGAHLNRALQRAGREVTRRHAVLLDHRRVGMRERAVLVLLAAGAG